MYQTLARLGFNQPGTYRILLATPVATDFGNASARLQDFLSDYGPLVYQGLQPVKPAAN